MFKIAIQLQSITAKNSFATNCCKADFIKKQQLFIIEGRLWLVVTDKEEWELA